MTHKGGWKDYGCGGWGEPLDPDSELIVSEGRFRCIRRVEGRIQETLWTYETPDAETAYQRERTRDHQRKLMKTMSVDELTDELLGSNQLDAVPSEELRECYERKCDELDDGSS